MLRFSEEGEGLLPDVELPGLPCRCGAHEDKSGLWAEFVDDPGRREVFEGGEVGRPVHDDVVLLGLNALLQPCEIDVLSRAVHEAHVPVEDLCCVGCRLQKMDRRFVVKAIVAAIHPIDGQAACIEAGGRNEKEGFHGGRLSVL